MHAVPYPNVAQEILRRNGQRGVMVGEIIMTISLTHTRPRDRVRHFEFFRLLHGNGLIWMEIEETLMETYQAMCNQSYAC